MDGKTMMNNEIEFYANVVVALYGDYKDGKFGYETFHDCFNMNRHELNGFVKGLFWSDKISDEEYMSFDYLDTLRNKCIELGVVFQW